MAADDLVTQGFKAQAAMVLTNLTRNIPEGVTKALELLQFYTKPSKWSSVEGSHMGDCYIHGSLGFLQRQ